MYKFLNYYRQIIHIPKIKMCALMTDLKANLFLRKPVLKLSATFPNINFSCPFQVKK